MPTITGTLYGGDGTPIQGATIRWSCGEVSISGTGLVSPGAITCTTSDQEGHEGEWSVTLMPGVWVGVWANGITPGRIRIEVPTTAGTYSAVNLLLAEDGVAPNLLPTLFGTGSPEGVVTATPGRQYYDEATQLLYIKTGATGNTGWRLIA